MSKSFSPVYTYPTEKTGFFKGERAGSKRVKDIKDVEHSAYGGWWPSFFPTSVGFLVTRNGDTTNVMTIACMSVVNAYPFMVGFPIHVKGKSERGEGTRYSYELLRANPQFTLNVPYIDTTMTKRVLICGSYSGRDGVDKIAKANFTTMPSRHVTPPILNECPLNLECRVHSDIDLGSHHWIIGKVEAVYLDEEMAEGDKQFVWRSLPELIRKEK
ncbi:MAG: flavin reductase family protein [Nitrospirae bacterium]|nr:flavin reductase family protein [Nitrospirota bacterium]